MSGRYFNFRGLAFRPAHNLVNHHFGVRQGESLLLAPAARITAAPEAAMPTQIVETSGLMCFIVSYIAKVAVTEPPGELI